MFKWTCLTVAVLFLSLLGWMANDTRQEVRRSTQSVQASGDIVNEHLPIIVEKTRITTETLAELSADLRQLKELAGVAGTARDQNLVAYADSALDQIEKSGGSIGLKKTLGGNGLKNTLPAKEWVVGARKEALLLTVLVKSKEELASRLMKNKFGSSWHIQFGDKDAVPLFNWLRENHMASNELSGALLPGLPTGETIGGVPEEIIPPIPKPKDAPRRRGN